MVFWLQNLHIIFYGSVLTSLFIEILISEGGSSFPSWTLFSCGVDGTSLINSGIMIGSGIMESMLHIRLQPISISLTLKHTNSDLVLLLTVTFSMCLGDVWPVWVVCLEIVLWILYIKIKFQTIGKIVFFFWPLKQLVIITTNRKHLAILFQKF